MKLAAALLVSAFLAAPAVADPVLPAPWNKLDFSLGADAAYKRVGAAKPREDVCTAGERVTAGVCWTYSESRGIRSASLYFPSRAAARAKLTKSWGAPVHDFADDDDELQVWHLRLGTKRVVASLGSYGQGAEIELVEMLPIDKTVAQMKSFVGGTRSAVTKQIGARTHSNCGEPRENCTFDLPPNEAGPVSSGIVDFDDAGVSIKASYVLRCDDECKKKVVPMFSVLGAMTKSSCVYQDQGEAWDEYTFAKAPGVVVSTRERATTHLFVCVGTCDRVCTG